uniref:Uncharacterized protein n=1 Tax=viral metagenome TaxID=1070528 RepID=A0A6M3LLX8_9ZZZZ
MFRCELCKKVIGPGIPSYKKVIETREKIYQIKDKETKKVKETKGTEIVKEISVCSSCIYK